MQVDPPPFGTSTDPLASAGVLSVANMAALKTLNGRPTMVSLMGYYTPGDGGGGNFYWVPGDTTTPDDGLVVAPTAGVPGRFKRIFTGDLHAVWFGAVEDGTTNDTAAWEAALDALPAGGGAIHIKGLLLSDPVARSSIHSLHIKGANRDASRLVLRSSGTLLALSSCQYFMATGLTFQAAGIPQVLANAKGLQLDTESSNSHTSDCTFIGFSQGGLHHIGTADNGLSGHKVTGCYFLGNGGNQFNAEYSNDFHYTNNQFGIIGGIAHADIGCSLYRCKAGNYVGNYHWQNVVGLKADGCDYNTYAVNRIEMSDHEGAIITGGSYVLFTDNKVHTNSAAGDALYDGVSFLGVTALTIALTKSFSYDSSKQRYALYVDDACTVVKFNKNELDDWSTGYGPIRVSVSSLALKDLSADQVKQGATSGGISSGTSYFGVNGAKSTEEDTYYLADRRAVVPGFYIAGVGAPGSGKSFANTLMLNASPTSMTATRTGTGAFAVAAAPTEPATLLAPGDTYTLKQVTDSGAATCNHRFYIPIIDY